MRTDNPDENVDPSTAAAHRPRDSERADRVELEHRVERLRARNDRLRSGATRSRPHRLRLAALGLVGLGVLSLVAAFVVPDGRGVLFALAGVGLFGGLLTNTLSAGRFLEGDDVERVYATAAANYDAIIASRGLATARLYLPSGDGRIRLFVPADSDDGPRTLEDGRSIGVDEDGLVLEPIGTAFVREVEGLSAETGTPATMIDQLTDAIEARFEFATAADPLVDADQGRAEIAVSDSAFGAVDRFDHPVASILAVGLARTTERPVRLTVTDDTDRGEWLVRCEWDEGTDAN